VVKLTSALLSGGLSRLLPPLLLLVHLLLFAWASVGLAEWLLVHVPWPKVSNPAFARWLLLLHWLAVFAGSITFVAGYLTRWHRTPAAMVVAYGAMAAVCVVETFWFLTGSFRFAAMAAEFAAYVGIVAMLHRHPLFRQRFVLPGARTERVP